MTIAAEEAGKAIAVVAERLLAAKIVQDDGYAVLQRLASEFKILKKALAWKVEVDRGQPIRFQRTRDKNNNWIVPTIVADGIHVRQSDSALPPFDKLDIALEVSDEADGHVARWHLDLANRKTEAGDNWQPGPLTHLQYGGHIHDARHLDHPLKVPRWCHPPMEVVLLCEVVAANFYEEQWLELRDDTNWCKSISLYEQLCYSHYAEKLQSALATSSRTALNSMWAGTWL